jgi:hypothetical protein
LHVDPLNEYQLYSRSWGYGNSLSSSRSSCSTSYRSGRENASQFDTCFAVVAISSMDSDIREGHDDDDRYFVKIVAEGNTAGSFIAKYGDLNKSDMTVDPKVGGSNPLQLI